MTSYAFEHDYDASLQLRAARLIVRRSVAGRAEAAKVLSAPAGAVRQSHLDRAIREALGEVDLAWTPEELDLLLAAQWSPDEDGEAQPPKR